MLNEVKAIFKNDPSARWLEFILYPGLHAIIIHKYVARQLYNIKLKFLARLISQISRFLTWIEIHPWAQIWKWLFIDHGMWVVIWQTVEIWNDCVIYHWVTLWWNWKTAWKRHPTVWNNVTIWANSTLLWAINIGDNVKIWAETVVIDVHIPDNCTVVWAPWRIVRLNWERVDKKLEKN